MPSPHVTARRLLAIAAIALLVATPGAALAKKGKKKDKKNEGIMEVGIESIDDFFADVSRIDRNLNGANRLLEAARGDLNSALGLKKRTTLPKAIAELDARADGKLNLVMKGKVPTLSASEAVPSDVTAGIDAVNGFTSKMQRSIVKLADAPVAAASLAKKSRTLPQKTKDEIAEGNLLDHIFKGPKAIKAVNHNMGITKKLPSKTDKTVTRLDRINRSIVTEFGDGKQPAKGGTRKRR